MDLATLLDSPAASDPAGQTAQRVAQFRADRGDSAAAQHVNVLRQQLLQAEHEAANPLPAGLANLAPDSQVESGLGNEVLLERLAALEAKLEGQGVSVPAAPGTGITPEQARAEYADWPQRDDERAQPWDLDAVGIAPHEQTVKQGKPDTVSPIPITHSYGILSSGSSGSEVSELGRKLDILGYATDIAEGKNPFALVTPNVMSAVHQFREDYNVREDPAAFGGNNKKGRDKAATHIGPFTWEALTRASDRIQPS